MYTSLEVPVSSNLIRMGVGLQFSWFHFTAWNTWYLLFLYLISLFVFLYTPYVLSLFYFLINQIFIYQKKKKIQNGQRADATKILNLDSYSTHLSSISGYKTGSCGGGKMLVFLLHFLFGSCHFNSIFFPSLIDICLNVYI